MEVRAEPQPAPGGCVGFAVSLAFPRFWGQPAALSLSIPPARSSPQGTGEPVSCCGRLHVDPCQPLAMAYLGTAPSDTLTRAG